MEELSIKVVKKNGTLEDFDINKVINAIKKSSERVLNKLTDEDIKKVCERVKKEVVKYDGNIDIKLIHNIVEGALEKVNKDVAKSYKDYRNYKQDFVGMLDKVYQENQRIMFLGDKENSNIDSTLVSTKRALVYNELSKEMYKRFFLTNEELQAIEDGFVYIHDSSARLNTMNCCLFNVANVLSGGFEMGNIWYNEPNSLDTAFDVISDIVMSASSQQYGGFTIPEVDKILIPYAQKSYDKQLKIYLELGVEEEKAKLRAEKDVERMFEQGFQAWEYKFNTVGSSRGDYPFITVTSGLSTEKFGIMCNKIMLKVRMNGQGKKGTKKPVLFPKIVFLYDKELHGEGGILRDVYHAGIECSKKTMYPDWMSLSGEGYVPSMYKKYKKVVSPMGCVDGQEVITYKYNNNLYIESFERMWERLSKEITDVGQTANEDINRCINLMGKNVEIYDTKAGFTTVKHLIRNVQNNWCDVTLSNGRQLRVTTDHPFETENKGVVYAKDLTLGDTIAISNNQYSEDNIAINTDTAWLYGVMLCDGCYQGGNVFASFAKDGENDIIEKFIQGFKHLYGVTAEPKLQERGVKGTYYDVRIKSGGETTISNLVKVFEGLFGGLQKKYRHIPNEVFSYTREGKLAFLAGMIDADGYINKPKNKQYSIVQIGSTNKELAIQQMLLIQSLGIFAKLYTNHYNSADSSKIRYRVEFYPTKELLNYIVCQKKKNNFAKNNAHTANTGTVTKIESLNIEQYSYDVTTESEHFEVSGVYSHNCRAFLSPWYERGGMTPADENDVPVFVGRFNIGAVSLHLPMILAKSRQENKDFYEVLDYYLELIRKLHIRTYAYLGEMKASINPLAYCEGGFYGGNLNYNDKIKPLLKSATASFGITALNEMQKLYNGKSLVEDGEFAVEVMQHINDKIAEFKAEDGWLYAIYGTPAEGLTGKQVQQFRKKYGIIEGVSDRGYVSNSFHCHVTEDITPTQKQDLENRFWNLFNGGKIQYVKYPINYNTKAVETLIDRAMGMGFYEGVNLSLSYCNDCGYEQLDMDVCPKCGSKDLTKIDRMNGYLSYSRVRGESRLNDAKMEEIKDRVSM